MDKHEIIYEIRQCLTSALVKVYKFRRKKMIKKIVFGTYFSLKDAKEAILLDFHLEKKHNQSLQLKIDCDNYFKLSIATKNMTLEELYEAN